MIFLDTGFLYALIDADDANHSRVRDVLERQRGRRLLDFVVTTNHVLAETLTLLRRRGKQDPRVRHDRAVDVGRRLYAGAFGRIHQVTAPHHSRAKPCSRRPQHRNSRNTRSTTARSGP